MFSQFSFCNHCIFATTHRTSLLVTFIFMRESFFKLESLITFVAQKFDFIEHSTLSHTDLSFRVISLACSWTPNMTFQSPSFETAVAENTLTSVAFQWLIDYQWTDYTQEVLDLFLVVRMNSFFFNELGNINLTLSLFLY